MKRILLITLVTLLGIFAVSAVAPGEKVGVSFPETVFDFGTVKQTDKDVTHEFEMTVTGKSPVAIVSANASCGCTRPKFEPKPTEPGKSTKIFVRFIPRGQKGEINKSVRVRLKNGEGKSESVTLRIKGVVVPE